MRLRITFKRVASIYLGIRYMTSPIYSEAFESASVGYERIITSLLPSLLALPLGGKKVKRLRSLHLTAPDRPIDDKIRDGLSFFLRLFDWERMVFFILKQVVRSEPTGLFLNWKPKKVKNHLRHNGTPPRYIDKIEVLCLHFTRS